MEKNTQGIVAVFALLALLVGFALGAIMMGEDTETIVNVPVEKIVNVSVVELVEMPAPDMLSLAVDAFMQAVDDEEVINGTGSDEADIMGQYDFDEIETNKVYDEYNVSYDDEVTTVDFSLRLRFDNDDDVEKESYVVKVVFEEDEDTIVSILA